MKNFFLLLFTLAIVASCKTDKADQSASKAPTVTANSGDNLVFFTHRYLVQDQQLMRSYQARANKAVNVFPSAGKEILTLAEKGQLVGDLVVLEDLYQAHKLKKTGLLQPFNAGTFGELVPSRYVDNEGYWAGLTRWTMSYVYRPGTVDILKMRTYAGVLDSRHRGRVSVAHPDSSGIVTMIAGMVAAYGEEPALIYLEELEKNLAYPPTGNDYQALMAVVNDQADIAFVNGSEYLRLKNSGNPTLFQQLSPLEKEVPVDANNNNYYNITPICLLNSTRYRDYAISMVEFLTIEENQNIYPAAAMEYPVNIFGDTTDFLYDTFNLAQGKISTEMTENQLDTARELIRRAWGL